jgi:2-aminoethylphosphonate-pyruvate transaminase
MLLLIPGPVSTRPEVRAAMAQDFAPWDNDFRPVYAGLRDRLRAIAGVSAETHAVLPLQGCGHFATEAAVRTFVPAGAKILIPMTGSYAERMARLAREAGRSVVEVPVSQTEHYDPAIVGTALAADPGIGHVGMVYSETSTGVVHDPAILGPVVHAAGCRLIVDAVSAFGALPVDLAGQPEIDVVVFTSNKCFEGLPGLSVSIARIDRLMKGQAGSWSFDLADIYAHAGRSGWGSFRFTPPAQVLAAFNVALDLFDAEGGQPARLARYQANAAALYDGLIGIGITPCLPRAIQGPIVLNAHAPADPAWSLQGFVDALKRRGFLISNFYNTDEPSFRVGCIGAITPQDMRDFVAACDASLTELGIRNRSHIRTAA